MKSSAEMLFGDYTLLRKLAHGGMAEVFVARQRQGRRLGQLVAIKRILPHLQDDHNFVRMFRNEARIAARLRHPNVVAIFDFGKVDEHFFIAMELIHGVHLGQLASQVKPNQIPVHVVAQIGADVCDALQYAHNLTDSDGQTLHLVHRDISPQNIMVSLDGGTKIVDFGIAKAADSACLTQLGIIKGKFAYMSPEQTSGAPLNGRSDVFSLALVLWELLAGQAAVPRANHVAAMKAIVDGHIPPIESIRDDVPPTLADAFRHALHTNPEKRSDALTFKHELENILHPAGIPLATWFKKNIPLEPLLPDLDSVEPSFVSESLISQCIEQLSTDSLEATDDFPVSGHQTDHSVVSVLHDQMPSIIYEKNTPSRALPQPFPQRHDRALQPPLTRFPPVIATSQLGNVSSSIPPQRSLQEAAKRAGRGELIDSIRPLLNALLLFIVCSGAVFFWFFSHRAPNLP